MVLPQVSKSENLQEVGRKIRHYREKKKMSQLELAEAKTASNKFFEFEHMMKQLSEADQELIFNMVMPCMKRLLPNT